jgi:hypothetical protein
MEKIRESQENIQHNRVKKFKRNLALKDMHTCMKTQTHPETINKKVKDLLCKSTKKANVNRKRFLIMFHELGLQVQLTKASECKFQK